ncbi:MAG TPA: hypothetical protein VFR86_02185, partial [Burkholderiaceae bacterium]|nr:hypothetical protein [Burkholderiaceae bacterium]
RSWNCYAQCEQSGAAGGSVRSDRLLRITTDWPKYEKCSAAHFCYLGRPVVMRFNYRHRAGYIKFFGTHAEYDRVDAATVDFTGVVHGKKDRRD